MDVVVHRCHRNHARRHNHRHGIGFHKLDALVEEQGEAVAIMARIKQALDPLDIMNPGKLVPPIYLPSEGADFDL